MRRKKKKENLLNEIKKEIGFVDGKSIYEIKPKYLHTLYKKVSNATRWRKNKSIYVIVEQNGNMPQFEVTNHWDIQNMISYSDKYNTLELYIGIWGEISVHFEDNAYNRYTIYFDL